MAQPSNPRSDSPLTPAQIARLQEALRGLQYGSVTLVFQDGVLVQIERNEKIRITH